MKLNPEELVVSSFETSQEAAALPVTIGPYDPTPMTRCFWCPPPTIGTDPATVVVVGVE
jgi:hypothetical protein